MIGLRKVVATLIALSLTIVPASAGAYAAGMAATAASQTSDCPPCPMAHVGDVGVMAEMAKSSDCPDMDGKRGHMTPATCAVFCNGLVALAATDVAVLDDAPSKLLGSPIEVTLAGHTEPPEPYPPKH